MKKWENLMNTNISGNLLFLLFLIPPILSVILSVTVLVKSIIHCKKTGSAVKLKYNIIAIACTILVAVSYVFNIGWLRVFGLWLGVPFIHAMIFVATNSLSADYIEHSPMLRINVVITDITYFLAYALLPDFGDIEGPYTFFGLINNEALVTVCGVVAQIALVVNIICIVNQFIRRIAIKKSKAE